jgi:hypothetical protein
MAPARRIVFVLAAVLAFSVSGFPDDTAASIGIGGLVFQHMDHIRMNREDLYISPLQVRIRFEFVNESSAAIDTIVAFPLPDIDQEQLANVGIDVRVKKDPVNFVGFKTSVNGEPVTLNVEQRAFTESGHRDVSAELRRYGVPLNSGIVGFGVFNKLPKATVAALKRSGIVDEGGGPGWTVSTKFWWRQRFEPGKTVVINQSYQPMTGSHFNSQYASRFDPDPDTCPTAATTAALKAMYAAMPPCKSYDCNVGALFNATQYVLTTGKNWDGPIRLFHLTLDKLKPSNILSTCWRPRLKQTSPTTFESILRNFTPQQDLKILVVERSKIPAN